jgi:periplasmic copper chaperone A
MFRQIFLSAAGAMLCVGTALAHVTLESQEAPVGASYKAVLRLPHGCDGSPTTAIRVRLPAGVIGVKPMPKPGWKLDTVLGKYTKPFTLRGAKVSEGVTEIAWSGGNLADAFYDEFVFTSVLAEELQAGQTIYFPVVQECEKGVHRWIDIPTGHGGHDDHSGGPEAAPGLKLLPKR